MKKTIVFLDADGVFSIYRDNTNRHPWFAGAGFTVWPIPQVRALLHELDVIPNLHPVWMTCWGDSALLWNFFARTRLFPVGYHLSPYQERQARILFPDLYAKNADSKLIAVHYYLRHYQDYKVVWLEDGFSEETHVWAKERPNTTLIDASIDPIRSLLLSEYIDSVNKLLLDILR